jgi:hypothetical protein
VSRLAPAYQPRRPTETVLYRAVREHLETFLTHTRETYERPLPHYVEQELRAYLRCGVFSFGFVRCHCDTCGHDLLVAFCCKGRGICPSCCGRRMANGAAHLVDCVLPDVPIRQFVLSLPYELRALAAFKSDVLRALVRIFVDTVLANYRARAHREGIPRSEGGAVTMLQRFGGSLNLNLHMHVAVLDGVFTRDEQGVRFHSASPPDPADLDAIVRSVHRRALKWLGRRGYLNDEPLEERSNEAPEQGAIEACAAIAMQRGAFLKLVTENKTAGENVESTGGRDRFTAECEGFNLHAGVHIAAGDDMGREKLCRYGLRPPLALERLHRLADGRLALRVKYPRTRKATHRIMTPLEFLARVAAIIPPPRFPLLRYAGVLAPHSSWRRDVVPRPREHLGTCNEAHPQQPAAATRPTRESHKEGARSKWKKTDRVDQAQRPPHVHTSASAVPATAHRASVAAYRRDDVAMVAPNMVSVRHWDRLMGGALYATSPRLDWAKLLRRSLDVDVLKCSTCHGRLRVIALITDRDPVQRILARLGIPTDAPLPARARDPTDDFSEASPPTQLELCPA